LIAQIVIALLVMTAFVSISVHPFFANSSPIEPDSLIQENSTVVPACTPNSLCPFQLQNAYGFNTLFNFGISGYGQTIVIVDACGDPSLTNDLEAFDLQFGLPNPPGLNITDIGGQPCVDSGWSAETSLDVEWAHTVAPEASIEVLVAAIPNPQDVYGAWTIALNRHLGNQISNSFGGAGCYNPSCDEQIGQGIGSCQSVLGTEGINVGKILLQAERENVTVLAGSGDSGAFGLGTMQVEDIPADCQGVLTVGGTSLLVDNAGDYEGELVWNASSGGGYTTNREPQYQIQSGIPDPFHSLGKPDVSAVADPGTGVQVYNNGTWEVIGGTSLSCPLWAGFIADVNQMRAGNRLPPVGFVNPFLYDVVYGIHGSSPLYLQDFHEITLGNNDPWSAGPGWDAATGLGSFIAPALAETLSSNASA
jgi:subtilase family serine protease